VCVCQVSQKSASLPKKTLHYLYLLNLCTRKFSQLLPQPFLGSTSFGPFVWVFVWIVSLLLVRPLSFSNSLWNSQTFFCKKNKLHHYIKLDITVSVCYVNYHILCSKCPLLADTRACSHFRKSFMSLLVAFCSKADQISNSCICKLGNCSWHGLKLVIWGPLILGDEVTAAWLVDTRDLKW